MHKGKRQRFASKGEAYKTFFTYFPLPPALAAWGVYAVVRMRDRGDLSYDHSKNFICFVAFFSVLVLVYSWYRAFQAVFAIMGKEFDNLPDIPKTVVCVECGEPFTGVNPMESKCPACGGPLEDLKGFYKRHPGTK